MRLPFVPACALAFGLAALGGGPLFAASLQAGQALSEASLQAMLSEQGGAIFRGLDKITARVFTIYAPLDVPVRFGSLSLTVRQCKARPPEEPPEKAVFVEIDETKPGKEPRHQFTGWMFWSSPALSALEHPVYDVWLIDCGSSAAARAAEKAAAEAAAAAAEGDEEVTLEPGPATEQALPPPEESEGDDAPLILPPDFRQ